MMGPCDYTKHELARQAEQKFACSWAVTDCLPTLVVPETAAAALET